MRNESRRPDLFPTEALTNLLSSASKGNEKALHDLVRLLELKGIDPQLLDLRTIQHILSWGTTNQIQEQVRSELVELQIYREKSRKVNNLLSRAKKGNEDAIFDLAKVIQLGGTSIVDLINDNLANLIISWGTSSSLSTKTKAQLRKLRDVPVYPYLVPLYEVTFNAGDPHDRKHEIWTETGEYETKYYTLREYMIKYPASWRSPAGAHRSGRED